MTNPFAAAIETLRGELEHMREDLDVEYLTRSGDISSHESSIRVLEAAGDVPANSEKHLHYHHATENEDGTFEYGCYVCNTIIALLRSIPDTPDKGETK